MIVYEARIAFHKVREASDPLLDSPDAVCRYMDGAFDEDPSVEWFYVILVNRKNRPLGRSVITKGTATASLVHPREVFRPAVLANACGIICVHNHPSGDPAPSSADISVTRRLRDSADTLQINLLDHLIIGQPDCDPTGSGYYSFSEAGLL